MVSTTREQAQGWKKNLRNHRKLNKTLANFKEAAKHQTSLSNTRSSHMLIRNAEENEQAQGWPADETIDNDSTLLDDNSPDGLSNQDQLSKPQLPNLNLRMLKQQQP